MRCLIDKLTTHLLAASACMGVSCSSPSIIAIDKPDKECQIQVVGMTLLASDAINPDEAGEPRPVVVRIYQLKDDIRFQSATFEQIWRDDKATLATDLVTTSELYAYPNTRTEVSFVRNPAAEFVVAAALFRNQQGRSWQLMYELPLAPGNGNCGPKTADGGTCSPNLHPQYVLWLDRTQIEEGSSHLQDEPDTRRVRVVNLGKSAEVAPTTPAPTASSP